MTDIKQVHSKAMHIYTIVLCSLLLVGALLLAPTIFSFIHKSIIEAKVLPATDIKLIDKEFNVILNGSSSMKTIVYYRFYPQETATEYKGRVAVTTQSKIANFFETNTAMWVLNRHDDRMQDVLMNKISYKTITDLRNKCSIDPTESYCETMSKWEEKGYQSVLMVPVNRPSDYSVIGYVLFMFDDLLGKNDLDQTVARIKLHLSRVEPNLQYMKK